MITRCYFEKLDRHVDWDAIYAQNETYQHQSLAINWLAKDTTGNSECSNPFFIERYALVVATLAAHHNDSNKGSIFGRTS